MEWVLRAFVELAPDVEVQIVNDPRPLEHARNLQVHRFLASTRCTHLFLLDSDCVPASHTIQRLLAHDRPIISAPHMTEIKGERGPMVVDRRNGGYVQHWPIRGLQRVDAVGGSGLLVRRDVLEKTKPPWFQCQYGQDGLLTKGEDFYFCEKMSREGYDIWTDCDLVQKHFKEMELNGQRDQRG